MLAFHLQFLGRSPENLKTQVGSLPSGAALYAYDAAVGATPQALAAAYAVAVGGDVFSFFSAFPNAPFAPPRPVPLSFPGADESARRAGIFEEIDWQIERVLAVAAGENV